MDMEITAAHKDRVAIVTGGGFGIGGSLLEISQRGSRGEILGCNGGPIMD
jgi:hypothetical protein